MNFKELWEAATSNLKDKSTNPFFFTLFTTWSVRHWEVIYTFFNFTTNETRIDRIKIFKDYFQDPTFICDLGICIGIAFVVMLISYLLTTLSRLLSNFFEDYVTPRVQKWTSDSKVVLRSSLEKLRHRNQVLSASLNKEREEKGDVIEINEKLLKDLQELNTKYEDLKFKSDEELQSRAIRIEELKLNLTELSQDFAHVLYVTSYQTNLLKLIRLNYKVTDEDIEKAGIYAEKPSAISLIEAEKLVEKFNKHQILTQYRFPKVDSPSMKDLV